MKEDTNAHTGSCNHSCCNALKEKHQEHRLRLLETQMMQNMYIQNAMHIQLVSQMKNHYQVPAYQTTPYPMVVYQQHIVPQQHTGYVHLTRPLTVYQPHFTGIPYQTLPNFYPRMYPPRLTKKNLTII